MLYLKVGIDEKDEEQSHVRTGTDIKTSNVIDSADGDYNDDNEDLSDQDSQVAKIEIKTCVSEHQTSMNTDENKEKPFKCDLCDKFFSHKQSLRTHKQLHTGEKPFQCEICNKSFARKAHLQGHMNTHTKEKPFKCIICERAFVSESQLKTHRLQIHNIKEDMTEGINTNY